MCQQKALNRGQRQYTSKKSLLACFFSVSSVRADASTLPRDRSSIETVIKFTDLTNVMRISLILLRCDSTGDGNQTHSTATIRL